MTLEGLWMVASVKAQEIIERRMAGGGQVSAQSAATVFGEQMLISFAGRAIARIGAFANLMREAKLEKLQSVRKALTAGTPVENLAKLVQGGNHTVGEELVRTDTAAMRAEEQALNHVDTIASDPASAAREGVHLTPEQHNEVKQLAAGAGHEIAEREIADLMKHTEVHGDQVVAEAPVYAELLGKHRKQGATISVSKDSSGHEVAHVVPKRADGTSGAALTLRSRSGAEVEKILADRGLKNTSRVDEYLVKRAGERAAALDDLRKVKNADQLDKLLFRFLGADTATQEAALRSAFGSNAPSEGSIAEIATVRNLARLVPGLAAQGPAKAEALAAALGNVSHWSADAREALAKLAATSGAEANQLFGKIRGHTHIPGADAWTMLVGREVGNPAKLLDYESSLDKAIELLPTDPTVAIEVDYYKGQRIGKSDLDAARAAKSTFDSDAHKNIDVEATSARYEMKRVQPEIHREGDMVDQIKSGVAKFVDVGVEAERAGGSKKNIVDVRYDDKLKIPRLTEARIRERVAQYISRNARMKGVVDQIVLHMELNGANVDLVIEVPL